MQISSSCIKALQASISGEVLTDDISRQIYSVDASIYEVTPSIVVIPKTIQDVIATVKIADQYTLPMIARGAATGITGGCLGQGIIIDLSKNLHHIIEINIKEEYVICEPGVVQDQLNAELKKSGYRLGPDTSTGDRATLGGMLANNSAGARSLRYGKMVDHIEEVTMVLASGEMCTFSKHSKEEIEKKCNQETSEGKIYKNLVKLREKYGKEIKSMFPQIPRHVSGYNLDTLLQEEESLNPSKLICGSEGTLGVVVSMKLHISKCPKNTGICLLFFDDMLEGMKQINTILSFHPLAAEMIDHRIITAGMEAPSLRDNPILPLIRSKAKNGVPDAIFIVEFDDETNEGLQNKLSLFQKAMQQHHIGYETQTITDTRQIEYVWAIRKAGLGLLLSKRQYSRAIAFIEDVTVAPEKLAPFMKEFNELLKQHEKEAGIYGHVGSGCMHIRPYIDLRDPNDLKTMKTLMVEVTQLLQNYGGSLSGEHGDGLIRSWLNKTLFGDHLYQAFVDLKMAFDPKNLMNPNKIVHGLDVTKNLRLSPETRQHHIETFLDFSREGGFELAVDLCNGNGACRKTDKLMCPSFHATRSEKETTRARAQVLRGIINGKLKQEEFVGEGLYDVLDLCIECKGCKSECPSQVDMAKMKSECLYHYHQEHAHPIRNHIFANIGRINTFLSPIAGLFNRISKTAFVRWIMSRIGISPHRSFPRLSKSRFSRNIKNSSPSVGKNNVVLFSDTYTEFHEPHVGQAALNVLSVLGYNVIIPSWQCCGRPMISKGMLDKARKKAIALIESLYPYAEKDYPIIILEPSCLSALKDDYFGLLNELKEPTPTMYKMVDSKCFSLEEFLHTYVGEETLSQRIISENQHPILFHGHCHQKALAGTSTMRSVLEALPGSEVTEIPSGCCGLAGSFGYEKEHYEISMKIANLKLIPFIKSYDPTKPIVANGFSCRSQIFHATGIRAVHLAEVISQHLYF